MTDYVVRSNGRILGTVQARGALSAVKAATVKWPDFGTSFKAVPLSKCSETVRQRAVEIEEEGEGIEDMLSYLVSLEDELGYRQ